MYSWIYCTRVKWLSVHVLDGMVETRTVQYIVTCPVTRAERQRAFGAFVLAERRQGAPPSARGGSSQLDAQHAQDHSGRLARELHCAPELPEQRADGRLLLPRRRRDARAIALDSRQPIRLPRLLQQVRSYEHSYEHEYEYMYFLLGSPSGIWCSCCAAR